MNDKPDAAPVSTESGPFPPAGSSPSTALAALRRFDPGARQLADVIGPRDNNSRIVQFLAKIDGSRRQFIAEVFDDGGYQLYAEVEPGDIAPTSPA